MGGKFIGLNENPEILKIDAYIQETKTLQTEK